MSIRNGTKFLLLFILFITFNNNFCKTFNVGKDKKYSSIKTAISSASSGDTLLIQTGIYTEGNIIIDKPLTIIGLNQPIIDGQNKFENITVTSSDVLISGLKLINSGVSFIDDNAAIKLEKVKNLNYE